MAGGVCQLYGGYKSLWSVCRLSFFLYLSGVFSVYCCLRAIFLKRFKHSNEKTLFFHFLMSEAELLVAFPGEGVCLPDAKLIKLNPAEIYLFCTTTSTLHKKHKWSMGDNHVTTEHCLSGHIIFPAVHVILKQKSFVFRFYFPLKDNSVPWFRCK